MARDEIQMGRGGVVVYTPREGDGKLIVRFQEISLRDGIRLEATQQIALPRFRSFTRRLATYVRRLEVLANAPENRDRLVEAMRREGDQIRDAIDELLETIAPGATHLSIQAADSGTGSDAVSLAIKRVSLNVRPPRRGGDYGGEFYQRVADAYRWAARNTNAPAVEIQKATPGSNVHTVRAWIRESRRRGFLGPGRRGVTGG
jgi:hypothetical protein